MTSNFPRGKSAERPSDPPQRQNVTCWRLSLRERGRHGLQQLASYSRCKGSRTRSSLVSKGDPGSRSILASSSRRLCSAHMAGQSADIDRCASTTPSPSPPNVVWRRRVALGSSLRRFGWRPSPISHSQCGHSLVRRRTLHHSNNPASSPLAVRFRMSCRMNS